MTLTAAQHTRRRTGLGASDIPAVLGLDPYRTPLQVFLEKTGQLPAFEGNQFTDWGNRLEPLIATAYADTQPEPVRLNVSDTLAHPVHDWALATPDRFVHPPAGLSWILECKNRGAYAQAQFGPAGTDEVPDAIAAQCAWQLFVTDLARCDVAVLLGGNDFRVYRLHRDDTLIANMVELAAHFWFEHVARNRAPDAKAADADLIKRLFPASRGAMLEGTPNQYETLRLLAEAKAECKQLEGEIGDLEAPLKLAIGEHDGLAFPDGSKCTWKSSKGTESTDWKAVAAALSQYVEAETAARVVTQHTYTRPGSRRFLVSVKGGN